MILRMTIDGNVREKVGVVRIAPHDDGSILKRAALLFDKLAVGQRVMQLSGASLFRTQAHVGAYRQLLAEARWLEERGFAFSVDTTGLDIPPEVQQDAYYKETMDEFSAASAKLFAKAPVGGIVREGQIIEALYELSDELYPIDVRRTAFLLRRVKGLDAYPVLRGVPISGSPDDSASKVEVVNVVLNQLPLPADDVAWEGLIEFRSDPAVVQSLYDLRNWMNEIARADLTVGEVEDRCSWLVSQFERHLALHRMKAQRGVIESLVTASADVIERVAKLKVGELARGLFALQHRKLIMKEAELTSPGSEVAYILKTRDAFGK
jgi:hypothetical protein